MDFYNMLDEDRLEDKRISKTSAVQAMAPYPIPTRIGPSDYVGFLNNDKICYLSIRGKYLQNPSRTRFKAKSCGCIQQCRSNGRRD
jgi:myo-inositol-1-phosphate synthase